MTRIRRTLLILLTTLVCTASQANTSLTFGFKSWVSKAKFDIVESTSDPLESTWSLRSGLNGTLRMNKFFLGASYLEGTFPFEITEGQVTLITEIYRAEVDVFAGYYFLRNLAILGGIKYELVDFINIAKLNDQVVYIKDFSGTYSEDPETTFAIGLTGFINIRPQLYGFGTASYLQGDFSLEFGASYVFERFPLNITAGYKYQSYETYDEKFDETSVLTFGGLILGVNYSHHFQ